MNIDHYSEIPRPCMERIQKCMQGRDEDKIHYMKGEPGRWESVVCKITGDVLINYDATGRAYRTKNYTTVMIEMVQPNGLLAGHETPVSKRALPLSEEDLEYLYCCDLLQWHSEDIVDWSLLGEQQPQKYNVEYERGKSAPKDERKRVLVTRR